MTLLSLCNVGKAYRRYPSEWRRVACLLGLRCAPTDEHWVLSDVGFDLHRRESIGIVGRNGAGKSTLLKLITGTVRPTCGRIDRAGGLHIAAILELGLGFVPDYTGRQNAGHTAELMGHERSAIARVMPEIEAFADIGDYFDQPVRTYSTGMQARVAFATVTAFRPDLLIVDEALSVGDAFFQARCFERIARYREQGTALILVTHAMQDVIAHCDRALLLVDGRLVADGTPAEVTNRYFDDLSSGSRPSSSADRGAFAVGDRDLFATRPGFRKDEHRWGDGGAELLDYHVAADGRSYPLEIDSGVIVDFALKVRFDADFENVVPGLLIKTIDGLFVYGTNSHAATAGALAERPVQRGQIAVFRFQVPMTLNAGDYLISFGISAGQPHRGEDLTPLDRRYDAVLIHVRRAEPFWGLVDLGARYDNPSFVAR